jgi:hypothetical protein
MEATQMLESIAYLALLFVVGVIGYGLGGVVRRAFTGEETEVEESITGYSMMTAGFFAVLCWFLGSTWLVACAFVGGINLLLALFDAWGESDSENE